MTALHASELARACADIVARDAVSRLLGIELVSIGPGQAVVTMTVTESMTNFQGMCHGGILFTLADAAFGLACNAYNQVFVGQHCTVTYIAPARVGERLVARASERARVARSGIYDVTVAREEGALIAEFRGVSRTTGAELIPGLTAKGVSQPIDPMP